jgi:Putative amidoligase enzyme
LISPTQNAVSGKPWRRDITRVLEYLIPHYNVVKNDCCRTHISISPRGGFKLFEVKRIAQAVIHFETALEFLVPADARRNESPKSNWLESYYLAQKRRSRPDSVRFIELLSGMASVVLVMQGMGDANFAWNFLALAETDGQTIQFRKAPSCTAPEEVLSWVEFAISFINAAIWCQSTAILLATQPTVAGLWNFIKSSKQTGVSQLERLELIFNGVSGRGWKEPEPTIVEDPRVPGFHAFLLSRLEEMVEEDEKRIQRDFFGIEELEQGGISARAYMG